MIKIMTKLSILFSQLMFYVYKPIFRGGDLKITKDIYMSAKKANYNLVTKL